MEGFEVSGGSVPGTDHTKPGQPGWTNNHDAFTWLKGSNCLVAIVADGCGSGEHSEVGAHLGSQLFTRSLFNLLRLESAPSFARMKEALEAAKYATTEEIRQLAWRMSGGLPDVLQDVVLDYFLCTLVGAIVTPSYTLVFALGDGVFAVNDEVTVIPPFPDNAPPYLGYGALPEGSYKGDLTLTTPVLLPSGDLRSILIGTDGVADLIGAAKLPLPGKVETLGPVSQFWTDDKFVTNPDAIRRRLAMANRETVSAGHVTKGLLHDDTTLVVIKRTPQGD